MSSTRARCAPVFALILCLAVPVWSADNALIGFVKASDRSSNPLILSMMFATDLSERLEIASALGERREPYVGDIVSSLSSGFEVSFQFQSELILRFLLSSLLSPSLPAETIRSRLEANRDAFDELVRRLMDFSDPQLEALLVGVAGSLGDVPYRPVLAAKARALLDEIEENQGFLRPQERGLLMTLLEYFASYPSADFLRLCVDAARLSRDKTVVDKARAAASSCAAILQ